MNRYLWDKPLFPSPALSRENYWNTVLENWNSSGAVS